MEIIFPPPPAIVQTLQGPPLNFQLYQLPGHRFITNVPPTLFPLTVQTGFDFSKLRHLSAVLVDDNGILYMCGSYEFGSNAGGLFGIAATVLGEVTINPRDLSDWPNWYDSISSRGYLYIVCEP